MTGTLCTCTQNPRKTPDAKPLLLSSARRPSPESTGRPLVTLAEVERDPAGTFVAGTMLRVVIVPFDNVRVGLPTHATGEEG